MTVRVLLPYVSVGVAVLVIVVVAGMFLVPAHRDGREAVTEALRRALEIEAKVPEIGGAIYEDSLRQARSRGDALLTDAQGTLASQRVHLRRWFERLDVRDGKNPERDVFASTYGFAQDELTRMLTGRVRQKTGRDVPTVIQYQPEFQSQKRLPRDLDEMSREQRNFNLQRAILIAAADAGAVPVEPMNLRDDWAAFDGERGFRETQVLVRFELDDRRVPTLLRNILYLEGDGPMMKLQGFSTRPRPLPKTLASSESLLIEASCRLAVYELAPQAESAEEK